MSLGSLQKQKMLKCLFIPKKATLNHLTYSTDPVLLPGTLTLLSGQSNRENKHRTLIHNNLNTTGGGQNFIIGKHLMENRQQVFYTSLRILIPQKNIQ